MCSSDLDDVLACLTSAHLFTCLNLYFVRVEMERKTLDCVCCNPGCDFVDYYDYLHDLFNGWLRPYLSLLIDPHWMAVPIPWIWIIVYSVSDGCAHIAYTSCTWDISFISLRRFSNDGVSVGHVLVKHFTPLSLGPHALGGICYTVICHRPYHSPSRTMEDPYCDLWTLSCLETIIKAFL